MFLNPFVYLCARAINFIYIIPKHAVVDLNILYQFVDTCRIFTRTSSFIIRQANRMHKQKVSVYKIFILLIPLLRKACFWTLELHVLISLYFVQHNYDSICLKCFPPIDYNVLENFCASVDEPLVLYVRFSTRFMIY